MLLRVHAGEADADGLADLVAVTGRVKSDRLGPQVLEGHYRRERSMFHQSGGGCPRSGLPSHPGAGIVARGIRIAIVPE
jgi:hypothetical protein